MNGNRSGYTMIELLAVVAIIGLIGVSASQLFFTTIRGGNKAQVIADVKQEGDYVINKIERLVRNGTAISACGANNLQVEDVDGQNHQILMQNNQLTLDGEVLIGSTISVQGFTCNLTAGSDAEPDHVDITLTLLKGGANFREDEMAEQVFKTSITMRNY